MDILSLAKAFRTLELLRDTQSGCTLTELVQSLGMSMGSVQRITNTLVHLGYIQREPLTKSFRLTAKFFTLTSGHSAEVEIRRIALLYMRQVNERLDEVVNLGMMVNDREIAYVDRVDDTSHSITTSLRVGSRRPIHINSIGRVIMAFLPEADVQRIVDSISFVQHPCKSFKNDADLMRGLATIRKQGYFAGPSESFNDIYAIAVPVLDYQGRAVAGINVVIPLSRADVGVIQKRYIPVVTEAARDLSRALGNTDVTKPVKPKKTKEKTV